MVHRGEDHPFDGRGDQMRLMIRATERQMVARLDKVNGSGPEG